MTEVRLPSPVPACLGGSLRSQEGGIGEVSAGLAPRDAPGCSFEVVPGPDSTLAFEQRADERMTFFDGEGRIVPFSFSRGVLLRSTLQVVRCAPAQSWIVSEPGDAQVAVCAEETSNFFGGIVSVVYTRSIGPAAKDDQMSFADETCTILEYQQALHSSESDAVVMTDPDIPEVSGTVRGVRIGAVSGDGHGV